MKSSNKINNTKHLPNNNINNDLTLSIINGEDVDQDELYRLLETNLIYIKSNTIHLIPSEYLVLCNDNKLIAAIQYTRKYNKVEIINIIVHPIYPEKKIKKACNDIIDGVIGERPINF